MSYWKCAAPNCKTTHGQGKIFRAFPKEHNLASKWLESLPAKYEVKPKSAFCELHFELSEFEATRQDGRKKLKASAVPSIYLVAPFQPPRERVALGDITNSPKRRPSSSGIQSPKHRNNGSVTVPWCSRTPIKPKRELSNPEDLVVRDHPYSKPPWKLKENLNVEYLDQSFLEACHTSRSVSHEVTYYSCDSKDTIVQDVEPSLLSAPSEISGVGVISEETILDQTIVDTGHEKVQPPPNNFTPIKDGAGLCPETGLFHQEPEIQSTRQTAQCISSLEDALQLIEQQRAQINRLEEESKSKSEALREAHEHSKTLAQNLNVISEDGQFLPLASVTKENVFALLTKQTAEISRLTKLDHLHQAKICTLQKASKNVLGIRKKYLALQKVNARLSIKLKRKTFSPFLTPGQQIILQRGSTRGLKWEPEMIRKGLMKKMACGTAGYSKFVQDLPLYPSVRALQDSIKCIEFKSGLLDAMFDLLETYAANAPDYERDCQVVVDEMAITPGQHFDPSTRLTVGKSTFPTHSGLATKGMAIMLAGISVRWKVTVAVYFTSERASELKTKKLRSGRK